VSCKKQERKRIWALRLKLLHAARGPQKRHLLLLPLLLLLLLLLRLFFFFCCCCCFFFCCCCFIFFILVFSIAQLDVLRSDDTVVV